MYNIRHGEDLLLSIHFMTHCSKVMYLNEGLYHYRKREGGITHSFDIERKEAIKIVHTELEKYIDQWDSSHLKLLHNARKVKGWIFNLVILEQNRKKMAKKEFKQHLTSMAVDPYFVNSYKNMNVSFLSLRERVLAWCLYKRQFLMLRLLCTGIEIARKVKFRKKHVG